MSNETVVQQHSLTKRAGRRIAEAQDGHTDFMVGYRVGRDPRAVEARALRHQLEVDAYLAEVLEDYAS